MSDAANIAVVELIQSRLNDLGSPVVVGMCGAQGSGKSTRARKIADQVIALGFTSVVVSLDDFYLTKAERETLAREVHPLLATRGVPGTHDVDLGVQTIQSLIREGPTLVPRFDKATDDRLPVSEWDVVEGLVDVVIFEGWCVGAQPQARPQLVEPLNQLERLSDPDGRWRNLVNSALDGPYRALFETIDTLVFLRAPSFEVVQSWRGQQESGLIRDFALAGTRPMNEAQLRLFISHYERLTRHMIAEMGSRADLVVELDAERRIIGTSGEPWRN